MNEVKLTGISSMATRQLLVALAPRCAPAGAPLQFESIGGVEAARRVAEGEAFDLVVLAADAMDKLMAAGHLQPGTLRPLADSAMAVAAPAGRPAPAIDTADALQAAVLQAERIGYSTGPSGVALMSLFERWGVMGLLQGRLVQARPGVPVASLIASGEVGLGFQQRSELLGVPGVQVLGDMPPGLEIVTTFSGAVAARSPQPLLAARALGRLCDAEMDAVKRDLGLAPPAARTAA